MLENRQNSSHLLSYYKELEVGETFLTLVDGGCDPEVFLVTDQKNTAVCMSTGHLYEFDPNEVVLLTTDQPTIIVG